MIHKPFFIAPSSIQGNGLFTSEDLEKGYLVLDYRKRLDSWRLIPCSSLTQYQIEHNWLVMVGKELCLTTDEESEIRYMNHSREPNCFWYVEDLFIETSRKIAKGEELLIDYRIEKRSNRESFPSWI